MLHKEPNECWHVRLLLIWMLMFSTVSGFGIRAGTSSRQSGSTPAWQEKPQNNSVRTKQSGASAKELEPQRKDLKPSAEPNSKPDTPGNVALDQKKQQGLDLLEGVLSRSRRITPIDYRILTDVEAATILWSLDRDRSISILKDSITLMRALAEKKDSPTATDRSREMRIKKLRFLVVRKIARLNPELVQELVSDDDKSTEPIQGEWTEESRALMNLAKEQIQQDPKSAARLFEQSLALGASDWTSFLEKLSQRDNNEAERTATVLIDRLRDSSITPIALRNLARFVLAPDRSSSFREHFFQSVAVRLRRDIRPDVSASDLEDDLRLAREIGWWTKAQAPQFEAEFGSIASVFEAAFAARSLASPGPAAVKTLSVQTTLPAKSGDTSGITEALRKVAQLADPGARDRQYQKLAVEAAFSADAGLAEEIMSKIDSEPARLETTALVYNPLVKKAINESDWSQAQKQASKIRQPLARTLAYDGIAQAMLKAKQDKQTVIGVYTEAETQLDREAPAATVAKAYLMLSKPLYGLDRDRALDAVKSCAYVLNKLDIKDEPLEESGIASSVAAWVRFTDPSLSADEILNLPDLIAAAFEDLARRNSDDALSVAEAIRNEGVYSMAQLAISKVLLEKQRCTAIRPGTSQKLADESPYSV